MKSNHVLFTALSLVLLATACNQSDNQPTASESAASQLDQAKRQANEAIQSAKEYSYAQKAEFTAEMRKLIADLNQQMDDLSAKVQAANSTAKEEAKAKLQDLRDKTAAFDAKLDTIKDATAPGWESVKLEVKQGYDELKASVNQARQWLSEKIASS
jgi:hypothetical protein